MNIYGIEIVTDETQLANIVKLKSSIDEVIVNTDTGQEVIEEQP